MKKKIEIEYWWKCDSIEGEIPEPLYSALEESAEKHIADMMKQGYTSGGLNDFVNVELPGGRLTPEDGWPCHGWWSFERKD